MNPHLNQHHLFAHREMTAHVLGDLFKQPAGLLVAIILLIGMVGHHSRLECLLHLGTRQRSVVRRQAIQIRIRTSSWRVFLVDVAQQGDSDGQG